MSRPGRRRSANLFRPAVPPGKLAGWRRPVDRALRTFGPSWRAAPWRRLAQVVSLGLFLALLFGVAWPYGRIASGSVFTGTEGRLLTLFLWLDPLVGVSTSIAARCWNPALWGVVALLVVGCLSPRAFCGYLCPLGTLVDAFDWAIGERARRSRAESPRRWTHLRYYLLAGVLAGSAFGVLLSGYVSAIPVVTRGLLFTAGQLQLGLMRNWGQARPVDGGFLVSVLLFGAVFALGLLGPRFWCRHLCPSGALLSVLNLVRLGRRQVEPSCTGCGKCREACPFGAVAEDFSTREPECSFCLTCGGVCPTGSIRFVVGRRSEAPRPEGRPAAAPAPLSRRTLLASAAGGAAAALASGPALGTPEKLLRPPGSVPEARFLDLCIRCGECFQVCPGPVLHPAGLEGGLEALWTPVAVPIRAGCHQECNFCTQVCPTGAIRPLTIGEKKKTKMGLAVIDTALCLPHRGERDCRLCFDECEAAGYYAIKMREIRLEMGAVPEGIFSPEQVEQMGRITAPHINRDACVGCGLCEYRCHTALVKQGKELPRAAVTTVPEGAAR